VHVDDLSEARLAAAGVGLPAIVKPLRGRGSQGVSRVDTLAALVRAVRAATGARRRDACDNVDDGGGGGGGSGGGGGAGHNFGRYYLVEALLPGEEITLAVLPPGTYEVGGRVVTADAHWALPPVGRCGHVRDVLPYSGAVPVTANSAVVPPAVVAADPSYAAAADAAAAAAAAVDAVALVRVDARRAAGGGGGGGGGGFAVMDVNFKPNLTAAGRPGRRDADALVVLAARAAGWTYTELLVNLLRQAWGVEGAGGFGCPPPSQRS